MGKTFLVEHLLEDQPCVLVIDSKGRVNWKGYHLTDNPVAALYAIRQGFKVIYRPVGGAPPEAFWMEAVQVIHEMGGGIIYIDELSFICSPNKIPKGLGDAFRLGGEIGVGIWYSAQEATSIHNVTLRQSEMLVIFYNQGASDRDKLSKIVGDMAYTTAHLPKWEFEVFVRGETYDHEAVDVYKVVPS